MPSLQQSIHGRVHRHLVPPSQALAVVLEERAVARAVAEEDEVWKAGRERGCGRWVEME